MKVAHVAPFFYPEIGGMENAVLNQCRELVKMGNEVHVYTCNRFRNGNKILKKEDLVEGISVHYLNSIFHIDKAHLFPSLCKELANENYDVIHTHAIHHPHNDIAAFIGKLKKEKVIFTSHSSFFPKNAVPLYHYYLFFVYDFFARFSIFRKADQIIALTPYDKKELIKRSVREVKIRIIPHGVDSQFFQGSDGKSFREKYSLDGKIVLNVGRLNPIKGLDVLVRALPLILKENENTKLVLIGPDEGHYSELKKMSNILGVENRVVWLNYLTGSELVSAYHACDVFCLPSYGEAFGLALLEAQATGKPVVASNVGGIPHVIKEKQTGLLVSPGNHHKLANAINMLLGDTKLRCEMGAEALKWASKFRWELITKKIFNVYREGLY